MHSLRFRSRFFRRDDIEIYQQLDIIPQRCCYPLDTSFFYQADTNLDRFLEPRVALGDHDLFQDLIELTDLVEALSHNLLQGTLGLCGQIMSPMSRAFDDTYDEWQPGSNVAKDLWEIAGFGQFFHSPRSLGSDVDKGDNDRGQSNRSERVHWFQISVPSTRLHIHSTCKVQRQVEQDEQDEQDEPSLVVRT